MFSAARRRMPHGRVVAPSQAEAVLPKLHVQGAVQVVLASREQLSVASGSASRASVSTGRLGNVGAAHGTLRSAGAVCVPRLRGIVLLSLISARGYTGGHGHAVPNVVKTVDTGPNGMAGTGLFTSDAYPYQRD